MYYGKKVLLRSLELSDVDEIMKHFNDLKLLRTSGSVLPVTREQKLDWVKNSWENRSKGNPYNFAITTHDGQFIGSIVLDDVNQSSRNAELGIMILNKENHNKGYGTDAIKTLCAFGFLHLNLHMIYLRHFPFNENGAKAYENAGFIEVGREREAFWREGKYQDVVRRDILTHEFFDKFPEYTLYKPE